MPRQAAPRRKYRTTDELTSTAPRTRARTRAHGRTRSANCKALRRLCDRSTYASGHFDWNCEGRWRLRGIVVHINLVGICLSGR